MQRLVDLHTAASNHWALLMFFSSEQDNDSLCTSMRGRIIWEASCLHCKQSRESDSLELGLEIALPDDQHRLPEDSSTAVENVVWSLQQILDIEFGVQALNDYTCPFCLQSNCSSRKISCIQDPPEILKVTLKWFNSATEAKKLRKLKNYQEVSINVRDSQTGPIYPARYGLYGIIFHHGKALTSGHYTCIGRGSGCASLDNCEGLCTGCRDVKCSAAGWRFWNDDSVSEPKSLNEAITAATELKKPYDGLIGLDSRKGKSPYILLLARMSTEGTFDPSVPQCALCHRGQDWRQFLNSVLGEPCSPLVY